MIIQRIIGISIRLIHRNESVAESSKEIDNAIITRNDRNSFKKGYLSGKSEQTLIEEFIVEIGTIMNGKE